MSIKKNISRLMVFVMTDSTGLAKTGANVIAQVSKDGGTFADSGNSVSELSDGFYKLILTTDEMNANVVTVKLTASGCEQQNLVVYTEDEISAIKAKTDSINWDDIALIKQIEQGRWKIENNQMIFYKEDGTTPLLVFDLRDKEGQPTEKNILERIPK